MSDSTAVATWRPQISRVMSTVTEYLGIDPSNHLASGGLTLGVLGALVASLRLLGGATTNLLWRSFTVKAEFDSRDESFLWIVGLLAEHSVARRTTRFSVSTSLGGGARLTSGDGGGDGQMMRASEDGLLLPRILFLPSPGSHLFVFRRRFLWLSRERVKVGSAGAESANGNERLTVMSFGRSRGILEELTVEARRLFVEKDKARTVIYSADQYGNWRRTRSRPIRPLRTIVLDANIKEEVLSDVREFLDSEKWYSERGIPYRRGYMLHGPPGTGKTSFVTALAGELKMNIYVISLANKGLTDETLTELIIGTPTRCILLLEDIDAAFVTRSASPAPPSAQGLQAITGGGFGAPVVPSATNFTNVTFSGLLNAIDGVAAQEGRILVLTTNHMEKLDPALIRPGRVDVKIHFDKSTPHQARLLFAQFFPVTPAHSHEAIEALAGKFESAIPRGVFSMATLQGYLMRFKGDPVAAVEQVDEFVESNRPAL